MDTVIQVDEFIKVVIFGKIKIMHITSKSCAEGSAKFLLQVANLK